MFCTFFGHQFHNITSNGTPYKGVFNITNEQLHLFQAHLGRFLQLRWEPTEINQIALEEVHCSNSSNTRGSAVLLQAHCVETIYPSDSSAGLALVTINNTVMEK